MELRRLRAAADSSQSALPVHGMGPRGQARIGDAPALSEVRVHRRRAAGVARPGAHEPLRAVADRPVAAARGRVPGAGAGADMLAGAGKGDELACRNRCPAGRDRTPPDRSLERDRSLSLGAAAGEACGGPRRASAALPERREDRGTARGDRNHARGTLAGASRLGRPGGEARPAGLPRRRRPQRRRTALAARGRQHDAVARHGLRPQRPAAVSRKRPGLGPGLLRIQNVGPGPHRRHGPGRRPSTVRPGDRLRLVPHRPGRGRPADDPRDDRPPRLGNVRGRRDRQGMVGQILHAEPSLGRCLRAVRRRAGRCGRSRRRQPLDRLRPRQVPPHDRRIGHRWSEPRGSRLLGVRRRIPPQVHAPRPRAARRGPLPAPLVAADGRVPALSQPAAAGVDAVQFDRRYRRLPEVALVRPRLSAPRPCARVSRWARPVAGRPGRSGGYRRARRIVAESRVARPGGQARSARRFADAPPLRRPGDRQRANRLVGRRIARRAEVRSVPRTQSGRGVFLRPRRRARAPRRESFHPLRRRRMADPRRRLSRQVDRAAQHAAGRRAGAVGRGQAVVRRQPAAGGEIAAANPPRGKHARGRPHRGRGRGGLSGGPGDRVVPAAPAVSQARRRYRG